MKNYLILLLLVLCSCASFPQAELERSVVELTNGNELCTGVQIRGYSGRKYILTAAHCLGIMDSFQNAKVITASGRELMRRFISQDKENDLALFEDVPGLPAILLAKKVSIGEDATVLGHGHGYPTYPTNAKVITMTAPADLGYKVIVINHTIAPGNSGGPAFDNSGKLIGIADATDEYFGYLIPLSSVYRFLRNY